jgi:hypothetical protein
MAAIAELSRSSRGAFVASTYVAIDDAPSCESVYELGPGDQPLHVLSAAMGGPFTKRELSEVRLRESPVDYARRVHGPEYERVWVRPRMVTVEELERAPLRRPMVHRIPRPRGRRRRPVARCGSRFRSSRSPGRRGDVEPPPRRPQQLVRHGRPRMARPASHSAGAR